MGNPVHPQCARYQPRKKVLEMARPNASKTRTEPAKTAESDANETQVQDTETPTADTTTPEASDEAPQDLPDDESTDEGDESDDEGDGDEDGDDAKAPKAPADLSPFTEALNKTLETRDSTTGNIAVADLSPVVDAYRKLEGPKAKADARKIVDEGVRTALDKMDIVLARAYAMVKDNLSSGKAVGEKKEKVPTDPTEAHIQNVAAVQLAYSILTQTAVPEGVSADWVERKDKLVAELEDDLATIQAWDGEGDEPDVSPVVRRAMKVARGKAQGKSNTKLTTSYNGPRRDIGKHILSAFEDKEVGTYMSVADIVKHRSTEYGDEQPSPGAVSARLFPRSGKFTLTGVEPVDAGDGKPKGARKTTAA